MSLLTAIPNWIKNKYFIAATIFICWMLFFDSNDLGLQWRRVAELKKLQRSEQNMQKQISEARAELDLLRTNPYTLEKYAREKYLMKKENEDIYLIGAQKPQ